MFFKINGAFLGSIVILLIASLVMYGVEQGWTAFF